MKPFVMARKNFLFSGSGIGAKSTCFIFTLIETAKANGLNPEDYLRCLFEKAPYAETQADWEQLLPWNIKITSFQIRGDWMDLTNQGRIDRYVYSKLDKFQNKKEESEFYEQLNNDARKRFQKKIKLQ